MKNKKNNNEKTKNERKRVKEIAFVWRNISKTLHDSYTFICTHTYTQLNTIFLQKE